jgi:hypothetical protein
MLPAALLYVRSRSVLPANVVGLPDRAADDEFIRQMHPPNWHRHPPNWHRHRKSENSGRPLLFVKGQRFKVVVRQVDGRSYRAVGTLQFDIVVKTIDEILPTLPAQLVCT